VRACNSIGLSDMRHVIFWRITEFERFDPVGQDGFGIVLARAPFRQNMFEAGL
jgi:hypothetical protein